MVKCDASLVVLVIGFLTSQNRAIRVELAGLCSKRFDISSGVWGQRSSEAMACL